MSKKAQKAQNDRVPDEPYKEAEFEEFLEMIGNRNIRNWSIMAEALDVSPNTISKWKKHPKAREAIDEAIGDAIAGMEQAGKKDWRMYREKAKMLGVRDKQEVDVTSDGEKIEGVVIYKPQKDED